MKSDWFFSLEVLFREREGGVEYVTMKMALPSGRLILILNKLNRLKTIIRISMQIRSFFFYIVHDNGTFLVINNQFMHCTHRHGIHVC